MAALNAWRARQTAEVAEAPDDARRRARHMNASPSRRAPPSASSAAASSAAWPRWRRPASATAATSIAGGRSRRRRRRRGHLRGLWRRGGPAALRRRGRRGHLEFENVPVPTLGVPAPQPVRPGGQPIHLAQDRLGEKDFFRQLGVARCRTSAIRSEADIAAATALPGVLKTCAEAMTARARSASPTAPTWPPPGRSSGRRDASSRPGSISPARSR